MKVEFQGAAQTVTGSKHLIHFRGKRLLLDCGIFQGQRKDAFERNRNLPFDPKSIDAVILSHAHIDHCGNLPSLVRGGFRGPIFATSCTRDLAVHMLLDSAKIQESDVKYVNKKRIRNGQTPFEPLYRQSDALQTIKQIRCRDFGESFQPLAGVTCKFWFAGHMIGAAITELVFEEEFGGTTRLVFSGDLGRPEMPMLRNPEIVENTDYLIMEATYGDRLHETETDADSMLVAAARQTYDAGGRLIVPAFSVGRTQEIVYRLNCIFERGDLPPMQVFVDSPLAVNASTVFREHVECLNETFVEQMLDEDDRDPLAFRELHYIQKVADSKALNNYKKPCIIISASGMCEAGRILHHLKSSIENPKNMILFTGYQAPHTLGRRILDGVKRVNIYGEPFDVRARVMKLEGASGHADQAGLLQWARSIAAAGSLKTVALVHCELGPAQAFREQLLNAGISSVIIPAPGEFLVVSG